MQWMCLRGLRGSFRRSIVSLSRLPDDRFCEESLGLPGEEKFSYIGRTSKPGEQSYQRFNNAVGSSTPALNIESSKRPFGRDRPNPAGEC